MFKSPFRFGELITVGYSTFHNRVSCDQRTGTRIKHECKCSKMRLKTTL